jgi:hypothetical protein
MPHVFRCSFIHAAQPKRAFVWTNLLPGWQDLADLLASRRGVRSNVKADGIQMVRFVSLPRGCHPNCPEKRRHRLNPSPCQIVRLRECRMVRNHERKEYWRSTAGHSN